MGKAIRKILYIVVVGGAVLWFFTTYYAQIDAAIDGEEIKPFFFQKDE